MPAFSPKFTEAQKAHVVTLIVDDGLSLQDAVNRCATDPPAGAPPFTMSISTASSLARTERTRRRDNDYDTLPLDQLIERAFRRLLQQVDQALSPDGNDDDARLKTLLGLTKSLQAIAEITRKPKAPRPPLAPDDDGTVDPDGFLARLERAAALG